MRNKVLVASIFSEKFYVTILFLNDHVTIENPRILESSLCSCLFWFRFPILKLLPSGITLKFLVFTLVICLIAGCGHFPSSELLVLQAGFVSEFKLV